MTNYIFDKLKKDFSNYLVSLGISSASLRNYMSDLTHFLSWAKIRIKSYGSYVNDSLSEIHPFITSALVSEYKSDLNKVKVPGKTINRRLSTLRHLAKYLIASQIIDNDFMLGVDNLVSVKEKVTLPSPLISDFKAHLISKKMSKNTLKNYLSDVRHFLNWIETQSSVNSN